MSFSTYNPGDRYRKRATKSFMSFSFVLFVLFLFFIVGFWFGKQNAGQQERLLKAQVEEITLQNKVLENSLVETRSEAQTAVMRYDQLQKKYEEQLPEGPLRDLLSLVKAQLNEGRDPERLAFLIRSARPPRNCSEIETKRFVVSTPGNQAPQSSISVADGGVIVKASGAAVKNSDGKAEAWFDPTRSVNIEFKTLDGVEVKKGVFPLHHSIVVGAREYRFTVSAGARSFAKVTFDSCDYP